MKLLKHYLFGIFTLFLFTLFNTNTLAQFTQVGSGSYTTTFPGVDEANRNGFPGGTPYISGNALGKPVPTNDWWSLKLKEPHVNNIFNYPLAIATNNSGIIISYIEAPSGPGGSSQPMGDSKPIVIGVEGMNTASATVSDYSDFTVTMNWQNDSRSFDATVGMGMPFVYFNKQSSDIAKVSIYSGEATIINEIIIIENASQGADFAIYAPTGSTWNKYGDTYTSTLNGKNYWSIAHLPSGAESLQAVASEYKKYAYVFPSNTTTTWDYNENNSVLTTNFNVECDIKEGENSDILLGLLPHQWGYLSESSPKPEGYSYKSIRGEIKTLASNNFQVANTFYGILPTLPYLCNYSNGFSPAKLNEKIELIENDGLSTWTDSYNEGQVMNRLIQTARIADLTGDTEALNKMIETVQERLEDWLTAESNEVAFLFYYNSTWSAMLGYPAGHGQDNNINDHHFHWGYFIHAAAFLEQYKPGWANKWGEMVNLLVRDAASANRDDELFPFLRSFSPYAGHCWANGFATFPFGNDQESTSESMQFNASLIHWGTVTNNKEIRDLGIYLYTTEQTAIEEYWMDVNNRVFKAEYNYSMVSRCWGNGYDNQTFWTSDIAAVYGIEMYPIHGGSLYLGHQLEYAENLWTEITENTGILRNETNGNLWHDVMWEYLAFFDPEAAIELYDSYPDRSLKFGISDAQTYYWLHAMNAIGNVDVSITADYPIAAAFNKNSELTYVAHNYSNTELKVTFSDGFELNVPPNSTATNKSTNIKGSLQSNFNQAFINGSVKLTANINNGTATKVEFFMGESKIGEDSDAPFTCNADNLPLGKHNFFARLYDGENYNVSNMVSVLVGQQLPFGSINNIPGTIEAGLYDKFEGGVGQGISYNDVSVTNEGDYRKNEYVDVSMSSAEGATVGWISTGEWLEYTVNVNVSGYYNLDFRYASANNNGGGPFYIEVDGQKVSNNITVNSTNGWNKWKTKTVSNIPFTKGDHVLRVVFSGGEFNLGKMEFSYSKPLDYNQPVAIAGENLFVLLPTSSALLDGTNSEDPEGTPLTYKWSQTYGPTNLIFGNANAEKCTVSGLIKGVYSVKLNVSNGSYSDNDELLIIVSDTENYAPTISIISPENNSDFIDGSIIEIKAEASDLDGSITSVDFYIDDVKTKTISNSPYLFNWTPSEIGEYEIKAVATDNVGLSSTSEIVTVLISEAPSCEGESHNGDFKYLFSDDDNNPTLTFIPNEAGTGNPTCILYYGTNLSEPFGGQNVSPNSPVQISATEGSTVYFYYTYTHASGAEKNTADNMNSYLIGSCVDEPSKYIDSHSEPIVTFPNPVIDVLNLKLKQSKNHIRIYDIKGNLISFEKTQSMHTQIDMKNFIRGIYILKISNNNETYFTKIVKN